MAVLFIWISWKKKHRRFSASPTKYCWRILDVQCKLDSLVTFWCILRTDGRTLCFSPGTAGGTRRASSPQHRCCLLSPPDPEKRFKTKKLVELPETKVKCRCAPLQLSCLLTCWCLETGYSSLTSSLGLYCASDSLR